MTVSKKNFDKSSVQFRYDQQLKLKYEVGYKVTILFGLQAKLTPEADAK